MTEANNANGSQNADTITNTQNTSQNPTESLKVEVQSSSSNDKLIAALGYLIFFLPLVIEPKSDFKTFHANQSLLLLIFVVAGNIIGVMLTFILIGVLIVPLVNLFGFVLFILGIVNAFNGEKKRLPLIGQFDLLK